MRSIAAVGLTHMNWRGSGRRVLEQAVWGALFLLVALIFSTRLEVQFTLPKLVVMRALAPVLAVLWIVRLARHQTRRLPRAVLATGVALSVWWVVSSVLAVHPATAFNGAHGRYNGLWNQQLFFVLFLILASSQFRTGEIVQLLTLLVSALVPVSLYALLQFAGWDPVPWGEARAASTIGNPVILAAVLGLGLPFTLVFMLLGRGWPQRCLWGAVVLIVSAAAMTTLSRGPLIATFLAIMAAAGALVLQSAVRLRNVLIPGVTALAAAGVILGYQAINSVRTAGPAAVKADNAIRDRLNTVTAALRMIRDHPLAGVGLENFSVVYPQYRSAESEQLTPDQLPTMAHSGYLQTAATTGLPGLFLYLSFISSVLLLLRRAYRQRQEKRARLLILGFAASIFGYVIQDVSGWPEISLSMFFWIVLGLAVAMNHTPHAPARVPPRRRVLLCAVAGACPVVLVWLCARSVASVRADSHFRQAHHSSIKDEWDEIAAHTSEALMQDPRNPVYFDKAGVLYAERYALTGELGLFQRSAGLLEEAHRLDPFHPYFLIHRIALETAALQKGTVTETSDAVQQAVTTLLSLDRHNGAAYESVARLRVAERRFHDALPLIQRACGLRPQRGRFRALEGDIHRALQDRSAAASAYRRALALFIDRDEDRIVIRHKLILTLTEAARYQEAVDEAWQLIRAVPDDGLAYTLLGVAYHAMGNLEAARDAFRSALRINPDDPNAMAGQRQLEARLPRRQ